MKYYIYIILSFCLASYTFEANSQNTFYYNSHKSYSIELQSLADRGDPKAINNLGSCYDRGDGVQQNHKLAFELFSLAAQKGEILACYNLGIYYEKGISCDRDIEKAIDYYSKAAAGDIAPAMYGLGCCYMNKGLVNDAIYWLEEAASKNFVLAMYTLGRYYYNNKSFSEAKTWLLMASEKNFNHADLLLARIYEDEGNNELVIQHYTKAANNGDLWAMDNMCSFYIKNRNYEEAVKWLEKAYSNDFLVVCHNLADCYYWGNGVQQSYDRAYEIFQKGAVKNGDSNCLYRLAMMTRAGQGCTKDIAKAIEMLKEAADKGVGRARYQIGIDYYTGEDIDRDYSNAVKYLELALTDKYLLDYARGDCYKKLSTCYRFGRGVVVDIDKADEYISEAAKYGNIDATKIQKWLYK